MVRRKNKKKRQIKKEGITINLNINQPTKTTTRRRRRRTAPQKKQVGQVATNLRAGIDPNFRTFDPYIRSKVMEMEQNNNALQGNYTLKLKAIEDGRQQDVNSLNQLHSRYNQFHSQFLTLRDAYYIDEERRAREAEEDAEEGKEYDFDEDGYGARGDGVDNSYKLVNKPALTGATNSVVNPSENKVIDPEKEAQNIKIAFNKEVDSEGKISPPKAITRSISQEGEAGEIEKTEEVVKKDVPEPLSSNLLISLARKESMGKEIQKALEEEEKEKTKTKLTKTNQGIVEKEVKIVPPITKKKRGQGVQKGDIRGPYYNFRMQQLYPADVFNRVKAGEINLEEASLLDATIDFRRQKEKEKKEKKEKEQKGGGK